MKYWLFSRHYKGFGIHSPFVFYLVRELIYERHPFYKFKDIEAARRMMLRNKQKIAVNSDGASSWSGRGQKSIRKIVREGSLPLKYGKLLFRLINYFNARQILELGTGTGVGTLFLARPDSRADVVTIESDPQMCAVARQLFEVTGTKNVRMIEGVFQQVLPPLLDDFERLDFVFFDGDHRFLSTISYFEQCLEKIHNDSVFVFDDIHWSPEMEKAWKAVVQHPRVTVSLDLGRIGVVFFRRECTKQHYVVRY
ncbi:MAG: O-methyltransferase [Marinilabiliaceae bacterium]